MKFKLFALFVIALSVNAVFGQTAEPAKTKVVQPKLPTAKKVIGEYTKAMGGEKAYKKLTSRVVKGELEFKQMGMKGTFEMSSVAPSKNAMKMTMAGFGDSFEGYDGTIAWTENPIEGLRNKEGEELLQTKMSSAFYKDIEFEKMYKELTVKGIESVNGSDAYVVEAKADGVPTELYYFDVKTALLVRADITSVTPQGRIPVKNFYSDYREIDGIKFPYTMTIVTEQMEIISKATSVVHNVKLEDKMFIKQ